jgi:hypothetical protein
MSAVLNFTPSAANFGQFAPQSVSFDFALEQKVPDSGASVGLLLLGLGPLAACARLRNRS